MAARPRSRTKRDWPKGLREPKPGYYGWENPETGKFMAIGRVPLAEAKMQALEANLHLAQALAKPRLVDRLQGNDGTTVAEWLPKWIAALEARGKSNPSEALAANTLKSYRSQTKALAEELGALSMRAVTVKAVADALEQIAAKRGQRTAQAVRSVGTAAFTAAIARGLLETNPFHVTEAITVTVKRQRFTLETFRPVWRHLEQDGPVWLRNAVALALVSAQRREDVSSARFSDFTESEWRLTQEKTGKKLAIPLELRLNTLGLSLRDVLQACRRTGVVSQYLVHQTQARGNSPVGSQIFVDTITRRFTEAVEAVHGEKPNLPTFHELRSLAKRLYKAQGGVDTQTLLGHETEKMGRLYADARGAEFERVTVQNSATNSEPEVNRRQSS